MARHVGQSTQPAKLRLDLKESFNGRTNCSVEAGEGAASSGNGALVLRLELRVDLREPNDEQLHWIFLEAGGQSICVSDWIDVHHVCCPCRRSASGKSHARIVAP